MVSIACEKREATSRYNHMHRSEALLHDIRRPQNPLCNEEFLVFSVVETKGSDTMKALVALLGLFTASFLPGG